MWCYRDKSSFETLPRLSVNRGAFLSKQTFAVKMQQFSILWSCTPNYNRKYIIECKSWQIRKIHFQCEFSLLATMHNPQEPHCSCRLLLRHRLTTHHHYSSWFSRQTLGYVSMLLCLEYVSGLNYSSPFSRWQKVFFTLNLITWFESASLQYLWCKTSSRLTCPLHLSKAGTHCTSPYTDHV